MPSPPSFAGKWLIASLAVSAAIFPSRADAEADPFALPGDLTLQSVAKSATVPAVSEIVVDGSPQAKMVQVSGTAAELLVDAADARAAGLPVDEDLRGPVALKSLRLYSWRFDQLRQQLIVERFRRSEGGNLRDFANRSRRAGEHSPLLALRLDYDLTASKTPRGLMFGGLAEAYAVRGNFSVGGSVRATTDPAPGSPVLLRLDSRVQLALDRPGMVLTGGDFVSAGSQSQRAVRMAGFQIASDFELRPDLITIPLPAFSGQVSVPTTLDLVGADQRTNLGKIEPGEFTVRNIATTPGRGEYSIILRDALGRETIETTRFYVSRDLLSPKTTAFAINAGVVRRRYGETGSDYGELAASAYVRRGITRNLTLEGSAEWTRGLANGGGRADFIVADFAKAMVEARFSKDAGAGSGTLLSLGVESAGRRLAFGAGAAIPSSGYRDVATRLGDPSVNRRYYGNVSYRLGARSQLQLALIREESRRFRIDEGERGRRRTDSISASFETQLFSRMRLFSSASYRRGDFGNGLTAAVGISTSLGGNRHANSYVSYNDGRLSSGAYYSKDDIRDGDIGYHGASSLEGGSRRVAGGATWRNSHFRMSSEFETVDGRMAVRANMRGTLLLAGGTVYARNSSGSSYALVRTGKVGGIPIKYENTLIGRTDKNGRLLVQDISPQATVRIDVDADKLPVDALVRSSEKTIRVPRRAVALVEIDAIRFKPVLRRLVTPAGTPLPTGLSVRALPSKTLSLTGFDGVVEINAGAEDRQLVVGPGGAACVVDLDPATLDADIDDRPLLCAPRAIVEGPEPGDSTKASSAALRSGGAQSP